MLTVKSLATQKYQLHDWLPVSGLALA